MKFYCIVEDAHRRPNKKCCQFLAAACQQRDIEFVQLESAKFDYSQDMAAFVDTPCIMYRLAGGRRTALLEALLQREGVANLYSSPESLFARAFGWGDEIRLQQAGLAAMPTIFNVGGADGESLTAYVERLGGFPVVLKATGGSHGSSVMRLDSLESLRSVVGYVGRPSDARFALRKYISGARHIRLVVVGDRVVDAIRYLPQPGDFRTNSVATPSVEVYQREDSTAYVFELAERAVATLGIEFGGVDVLIDERGEAVIAEVNFPCNFSRNQAATGTDIAGALVDHLVAKATQ